MFVKSKVVTKRSALYHGHFSLDRLFSFFYLTSLTFEDLQIMNDDYDELPHQVKRFVLLKIVESYHALFQRKIVSYRKAHHELLLRIVFETLKKIIRTSNVQDFMKDIRSSPRREKNHQMRINILVSRCRKYCKCRKGAGQKPRISAWHKEEHPKITTLWRAFL